MDGDFSVLTKSFTMRKKCLSRKNALISTGRWFNFGEGEGDKTIAHKGEFWMKTYFSNQDPWQKVCILKGRCGMILKLLLLNGTQSVTTGRGLNIRTFSYENEKKQQQRFMVKALSPDETVSLAPYKLAYTVTKYKMHFSKCDAIVEFTKCADPQSKVFS